MNSRPDYLVIGHVSKDLIAAPPGYAPGGTVLYSSITAQRLGLQAAIVTACAREDDALLDAAREEGVWVHRISSPATTTFRNTYDANGLRAQVISAQGSAISYADVPDGWHGALIVHLGPVAQELPAGMVHSFPDCLLGITPQGWMRSWSGEGEVKHSACPIPSALLGLPANAFLALSIEDLDYDPALLRQYTGLAPLVAVTQGREHAYVCADGRCSTVPPCQAEIVDPTGAGDVFAAALFVRYRETGDLMGSARFAHAAAACSIEGQGTSAIPDRRAVEQRLKTG